jgi:FtsP/CotA-like multicopper oxidase with cupredoxin domain
MRLHGRSRRLVLVLAIIVVAGTGGFVAANTLHWFGLGTPACGGVRANGPGYVHFTIVESHGGFNDSVTHGLPWPIMKVTIGDKVTIHIVNNDQTGDSHGFIIGHYFIGGVVLHPGECYDLTFTTDQTGSFLVYCDVTCKIHDPWMLHGEFNVNP